jgi:cholest-4-en-3-one 26-monooxygenase
MRDAGLLDLDTWQRSVPFDVLDELRASGPVQQHPNNLGRDFWAITGHAEVVEASRDNARFAATANNSIADTYPVGYTPETASQQMMHMLNGHAHTRLRGLVSKAFTRRVITDLEAATRNLAKTIVSRVVDRDEFDFVDEVSAALPLAVICNLMGIPEADRPLIFDWTNRMMGGDDPEYGGGADDMTLAAQELYDYSMALAAERRKNPGTDLTSLLLQAEIDGDHLSDAEFQAFFQLLSAAGNETTRNLISHGMVALMGNPDQQAMLQADFSLIPRAIEEMLRWGSPVLNFARDVVADTELGGVRLRAGDKVVLWYIAANRDPLVFEDPHRFDITRSPNPHTSFGGGGPHFCLGANLARMEARVMFEELFTHLPDLELAGEISRMRSNMFHGLKHIPVRTAK